MNAQVKTGCTLFYVQKFCEQTHSGKNVALKKRSRFTPSRFLPGIEQVQLVWIAVKIVPVILAA